MAAITAHFYSAAQSSIKNMPYLWFIEGQKNYSVN